MLSRGKLRSLVVGVFVAVPSGAGVALSVLGGHVGSLVGVAISASLLPPAVNCGLFWAVAAVAPDSDILLGYSTAPGESKHGWNKLKICNAQKWLIFVSRPPHIKFDWLSTESHEGPVYEAQYSDNLRVEVFVLGLVSLTLTAVNIACIIVTGIMILKLKEVTPDKIPQTFSHFWKRDIKAHRDYYHTFKGKDSEALFQEAREVLDVGKAEGLAGSFLQSVFEGAQAENEQLNIREWVAQPPSATPSKLSNRTMLQGNLGIPSSLFSPEYYIIIVLISRHLPFEWHVRDTLQHQRLTHSHMILGSSRRLSWLAD